MKTSRSYLCFLLLAASVAYPRLALAQTSPTYVSSNVLIAVDTNPCTLAAPCLTLNGALAKTSPGGEIDILTDGNYGSAFITQAVTIDGGHHHAMITSVGACTPAPPSYATAPFIPGVAAGSTAAFCIEAGNFDAVTLRNLTINLQTGSGNPVNYGILFGIGGFLRVENVTIDGSAAEPLNVGIYTQYGFNTLDNVRIQHASNSGSGIGVIATGGAKVNLTNSSLMQNDYGVVAQGGRGATVQMSNCVFAYNTTAISTSGGLAYGGTIRIAGSSITDNTLGLQTAGAGGLLYSFGNNAIFGNTTNGSPAGVEPLK